MIISHKYKFIFIKTYKTAGTSIESYLSEFCSETDVLTPIYPPVLGHFARNDAGFYNHIPALEVQKKVGAEVWNSYFKFCVERNPWDKALSFYWMERHRSSGLLEIDDFLTREQIGLNWPLYTDQHQTRPILDKVLKYEALDSDLEQVFKKLGLPWYGKLKIKAKSEYRQDRRHYREALTPQQAEIIARRFSQEIDWHQYVF